MGRNTFEISLDVDVRVYFQRRLFYCGSSGIDGVRTSFSFVCSTFRSFFRIFNTTVDVKLQQWAEKELPKQCVAIGQRVLLDEFQNLIAREQQSRTYDPISNELKKEVVEACRSRHKWDNKALDSLVNDSLSFVFLIFRFSFRLSASFKLKFYKIETFPINNNGKQQRNSWKMLSNKNSFRKNYN